MRVSCFWREISDVSCYFAEATGYEVKADDESQLTYRATVILNVYKDKTMAASISFTGSTLKPTVIDAMKPLEKYCKQMSWGDMNKYNNLISDHLLNPHKIAVLIARKYLEAAAYHLEEK